MDHLVFQNTSNKTIWAVSHLTFVIAFVVRIQVACKYLQDESLEGDKLLEAIARAVGVYYNSSGQAKCFNTSQQAVSFLGDEGWYFQVSNLWHCFISVWKSALSAVIHRYFLSVKSVVLCCSWWSERQASGSGAVRRERPLSCTAWLGLHARVSSSCTSSRRNQGKQRALPKIGSASGSTECRCPD